MDNVRNVEKYVNLWYSTLYYVVIELDMYTWSLGMKCKRWPTTRLTTSYQPVKYNFDSQMSKMLQNSKVKFHKY